MTNILELPEECIAQILSLTTPIDVLGSSALVSKQFLSISNSNPVWAGFLPPDCDDIVSQSSGSIPRDIFGSKKDLFVYLCRFPILLENNTKSFALDKRSGKTCYMLGSRALSIIWGSSPEYWSWESIPESRFPECAVLENVCWLDIKGRIHTTLLSPNTTYGAYFVFNFKVYSGSTSFGRAPVKVSVLALGEDGLPIDDRHTPEVKSFYLKSPNVRSRRRSSLGERPVARSDGLMEIEMGTYRVEVDEKGQNVVLEMSLKEIELLHWKSGLVVHGIELRPLC
ncbi:hypothetical protein RND81_02G023400 [Saponaria officinalis]|uniref:F-box domain-containing protein n=1 Tax=Saponaria officinalis TaxID=3572 RepID=A0AAW1MR42_SAPOF